MLGKSSALRVNTRSRYESCPIRRPGVALGNWTIFRFANLCQPPLKLCAPTVLVQQGLEMYP
jgi:hypothetical protein